MKRKEFVHLSMLVGPFKQTRLGGVIKKKVPILGCSGKDKHSNVESTLDNSST